MAGVINNVLDLVGNTPLVRLHRIAEGSPTPLLAKLEGANPGGSVKDRVAVAMIQEAEKQGLLHPGMSIVEATSGNTGTALAMAAAARGYRLVIYMPDNAPKERRRLLIRLGATINLTSGLQGMEGAMNAARGAAEDPNSLYLDLFNNPAVAQAHRDTTAREVLDATEERVGAFVAGVGTGGTITGVGGILKDRVPSVRIVAIEPASSPLLSRDEAGFHSIPGIGADFPPPLLNRSVIDQVIAVSDDEANKMALRLGREEGLLVGISSGANVVGALRVAHELGPGWPVVTILPDRGELYTEFPS